MSNGEKAEEEIWRDWMHIHPPFCEWVNLHSSENPIFMVLTMGSAEANVNGWISPLPPGAVVQYSGNVQVHNTNRRDLERSGEPETEIRYTYEP